jgi:hypothetical protein
VGNFYTNITLRSQDTDRITRALAEQHRTAFVAEPHGAFSVVYDEASEEQDPQVLDEAARRLSARLDCAALAVVNHDDDVLWLGLYDRGQLLDEYTSAPGYFEGDDRGPEGGDAERLCRALGAEGRAAEVESVLRTPSGSDEGYTFEVERHQALVEALGLPVSSVGAGFTYIEAGELPEGLEPEQLRRVG